MTLDSGLLFALLREIQPQAIGVRIGDILGVGPLGFAFALHPKDAPQRFLVAFLEPRNTVLYLRDDPPQTKGSSPFISLLRQHLLKARVRDIIQLGFDRIAKITLVKTDELGIRKEYALVLEFLGSRTNAFLVRGEDGKILGQLRPEKSAMRTLGVGKTYSPPSDPAPYDLLTVTQAQFLDLLNVKQEDSMAWLKRNIRGLSPEWAEEIFVRAGSMEPAKLYHAFEKMRSLLLGTPNPVLYLQNGKPRAISPFSLAQYQDLDAQSFNTLSQAFAAIEPNGEGGKEPETSGSGLLQKLQIRLNTLEDPDRLRKQAEILEHHLRKVPEHALEYTTEGVTITLDPRKTPEENLQALYKRYRKAKQGRETLKAKIEALKKGTAPAGSKHAKSPKPPSPPAWEPIFLPNGEKIAPRRFTSPHGYLVLVGRTNTENDLLTLKYAGPQDTFLHTRGTPGSHTILRGGARKEKPPKEDLLFAAKIAAYFSKARQARHVEVSYTERKYVSKPRGAKPGLVMITQEKTLYVEPGLPEG